jgi:hypothetical protein
MGRVFRTVARTIGVAGLGLALMGPFAGQAKAQGFGTPGYGYGYPAYGYGYPGGYGPGFGYPGYGFGFGFGVPAVGYPYPPVAAAPTFTVPSYAANGLGVGFSAYGLPNPNGVYYANPLYGAGLTPLGVQSYLLERDIILGSGGLRRAVPPANGAR